MKRLLPALLAFSFLGLGCLVTARTIPSDAKPVFDGYVAAVRNADIAAIDRLLCASQNHQAVETIYQNMLDTDRATLADALSATAPSDASTDTQLEFLVQPNPAPGSASYRYVLTKSDNAWCVED